MFRKSGVLTACALACSLLAGCGGGGGGDSASTVDGELTTRSPGIDDGTNPVRPCDVWTANARNDGTATVDMGSSSIDSYLYILERTGDLRGRLITTDDDSGPNYDARASFRVYKGSGYYVICSTSPYASRRYGGYKLTFSRELGSVEWVNPSQQSSGTRILKTDRPAPRGVPKPANGDGAMSR